MWGKLSESDPAFVGILLPPEVQAQVKSAARRRETNVSQFIRAAIENELRRAVPRGAA